MRSNDSTMTARTPRSCEPFAAQSRETPRAVLLAGEHDERRALRLVLHRRVVDRHRRAVGKMHGDAALGSGRELVAQPRVGEGAAHHHFVVPAPRAVGVELRDRYAVFEQPLGRGPVAPDDAGR